MKQQWTKRLLAGIATLALALPIAFGLGQQHTTHADDTSGTQTVVLQKYGFSTNPTTAEHQTNLTPDEVTGTETSDKADAGWAKGAQPLQGVEFAVYDVTSTYWADPSKYPDGTVPAVAKDAQPVAVGTTGEGENLPGQISFDLKKISNGHNAVYVFKETQTRSGYATSDDFVLSLPAEEASDHKVYVYPKNQQQTTFERHFKKIDAVTKHVLGGADFKINTAADESGKYLQVTSMNGKTPQLAFTGFKDILSENLKINWTDDVNAATVFTSDDNGDFGLNGFSDNTTDYYAIETQAPKGYEEAEATEFTPSADKDDVTTIEDQPTHLLPHTGGAGILAIVAVGAALLAVAFVGIRKRQARA